MTPWFWHFRVVLNGQPKVEVWGDRYMREVVFDNLSDYAIAFERAGVVSVQRHINGEWEACNGWRELAH